MKPAAEACDGLAAIAAHPFDRFLCGVNPPSVGAPVQIHVDRAGGHGRLPAFGAEVNRNPFLLNRARECQKHWKTIPNFVAVDFVSIGNTIAAVAALNGVG